MLGQRAVRERKSTIQKKAGRYANGRAGRWRLALFLLLIVKVGGLIQFELDSLCAASLSPVR